MRTHAEDGTSAQRARLVARDPVNDVILLAFAGALAASVLVFVSTASQPILEWFGFRQAQTALTAYWFIREGFALAYQTPVLGYPWAIPL